MFIQVQADLAITVQSMTHTGIAYAVSVVADRWHCTCPDHRWRQRECKHIGKVQAACQRVRALIDNTSSATVPEAVLARA